MTDRRRQEELVRMIEQQIDDTTYAYQIRINTLHDDLEAQKKILHQESTRRAFHYDQRPAPRSAPIRGAIPIRGPNPIRREKRVCHNQRKDYARKAIDNAAKNALSKPNVPFTCPKSPSYSHSTPSYSPTSPSYNPISPPLASEVYKTETNPVPS